MFSNFVVGACMGLGVGGWFYAKVSRTNGGQARPALLAAVISGAIACLIITTLLSVIFHQN